MVESILDAEAARGRAEGELNAYRDALRRWLSGRFGPLPDSIARQIEACADIPRLQAAIDRVLQMTSLEEFSL